MQEDKLKDFKILKKIGEGSFGSIYLVKHIKTHGEYVLKKIDTSKMDNEDIEDSKMEFLIHKTIRSPYIVKYQTHFIDGNFLCILLEYMNGGDLGQLIEKRDGKLLDENTIWNYFIQTCLGIQYLHTRKILHRDLKSTNLFLSTEDKLKIGDLGVAKELKTSNTWTVVGTPYYLSPQLWEEKPYNSKSDIWSLGWILYELWTLKHPFDARTMGGLYLKIIKGSYMPVSSIYSNEIHDLIQKCLEKKEADLPTIQNILENKKLIEMAEKLGYHIPSYTEVNKEIKHQRAEMMSTFKKKKAQLKKKQKPVRKYMRPFTARISDLIEKDEEEKSKDGNSISARDQIHPVGQKSKISLVWSEAYEIADKVLNNSPVNNKAKKPSYLKYVKNPVSTRSKDSESWYSALKKKMVNKTDINNSDHLWVRPKRNFLKKQYNSVNSIDHGGVSASQEYNIEDSIMQAYQLIHNKIKKPKYVKPKFTNPVGGNFQRHYKKGKLKRKITIDEDSKKELFKIQNLPKNTDDKIKSRNQMSGGNSIKSSKSVREMLTPSNKQAKVVPKESKRGKVSLWDHRSDKKIPSIVKKCKFDIVGHKKTKIERHSIVGSTKESENGSSKKSKKNKHKIKNKHTVDLSDYLFSKNKDEESDSHYSFEENAREEELDEALHYHDVSFDPEDQELWATPLSTHEDYNSSFSEISENN